MAGMEQREPTSTGSESLSIQLHGSRNIDDGRQQWKPTSTSALCLSQRWNFYLGVALSVGGIVVFMAGACSNQWLVLADNHEKVTAPYRDQLLAYVGPWQACTHGGDCDLPWKKAPGLGNDERVSVQAQQGILVLSMLAYLTGGVVVCLNLAKDKLTQTCSVLDKALKVAVPEFYISTAAVLGIMSMLAMGVVKERVLPHPGQTLHIGWAFFACLAAIIITVVGAVLMMFNRHLVPLASDSMSRSPSPITGQGQRKNDEGLGEGKAWRWKRRFWRRDSIPHVELEEYDMQVSTASRGPLGDGRGDGEGNTGETGGRVGGNCWSDKGGDCSEPIETEKTARGNDVFDDTNVTFGRDLYATVDVMSSHSTA